jgi:hypothetical protein
MFPELSMVFCLSCGPQDGCAFFEAHAQARGAPGGVIVHRHGETPRGHDEREHPHIEVNTATATDAVSVVWIDTTKVRFSR